MSELSSRLCPGPEAFSGLPSQWGSRTRELSAEDLKTFLGGSRGAFPGPCPASHLGKGTDHMEPKHSPVLAP